MYLFGIGTGSSSSSTGVVSSGERTVITKKSHESSTQTMIRITGAANFIFENVIKPVAIGMVVGAMNVVGSQVLESSNLSKIGVDPEHAQRYEKYVRTSFTKTAISTPLVEEITYRFLLQGALEWIGEKIFPDVTVSVCSYKTKLSALVALVATSVIFGMRHSFSGMGVMKVAVCTIGGVVYGILKQRYGILASISAHMTNNSLCFWLNQAK